MACLAELVQNIAFPALVLDDRYKVVLSNSIEARACNLSGSSAVGKTLADFSPGNQAGFLHDACLKAMESKEPGTHRVQLESPDGLIDLTARMIPIFNVGSMTWNLILTLEENPTVGANWRSQTAKEGRAEQYEAKANGGSEAEDFKAALRLLLREGATSLPN
jgi:hypothetical protein